MSFPSSLCSLVGQAIRLPRFLPWANWLLCVTLLHCSEERIQAAVIRGMVVENFTGRPLQRASVTIQPIPGSAGQSASLRTNRFGAFESPNLPGGAYLMTISRSGFLTMQYGQRDWKSAGYPISIQDGESTFLNIRMWRFGAISGTVVDEDEIGLPDQDVIAYRNTRPPQIVTRGKTDDRGNYRIGGLLPGSYLVRAAGRQYDEDSYLPTFHRESAEADQATAAEVLIEDETRNVNARARPGRLVRISGGVLHPDPGAGPVTVTLVSDLGRQVQNGPAFRFANLVPGRYELYGQAPAAPFGIARYGGLLTVPAFQDAEVFLQLVELRGVGFQFRSDKGEAFDSSKVQVLARRNDAAGPGETIPLKINNNSVQMVPGRWEFAIAPNPDFYVSGFSAARYAPDAKARPDGWNEVSINGTYDFVRFIISNQPGAIRGVVNGSGREPAIGAPVYLEAYDLEKQKRVIAVRETRTDTRGQYRFTGLAPGTYRLMSTFELGAPDSDAFEFARAKSIKVDAGRDVQLDLDLYGIR